MATPRYVVGVLIAASLGVSVAQAATFGHSRLLSGPGQPLHLEIPVTALTQQEIDSLRAVPAPATAWQEAGMTPPVALDSMRLVLLDGFRPDVKVIQLRSNQVSGQLIVDVLLDVRSASGQQRYQVSLLAHADTQAVQRAQVGGSTRHERAIDGRSPQAQAGSHPAAGRQITVRAGDNMFAVARRNAVQGVTVYQMMIALQQANPQAFIADNVNLVKAGASLRMPDLDALTALSDREARRLFLQHAQAFARYRQRSGAADVAALSTLDNVAQGSITEAGAVSGAAGAGLTPESSAGGDRLRLSGGAQAPLDGGSTAALQASGVASATVPTADDPAVSLLASSGAIKSDAVIDKSPQDAAISTGGVAASAAAGAAGSALHPDDQAAAQKNQAESRARVLELEDNVRHLNEALQKQGHVAAEAALEGARSFTEVIKEVMGLEDEDAGPAATGQAEPQAGSPAGAAVSGGAAGSPAPGASGQGGSVVSPASSGTDASGSSNVSTVKAEKKVSWFQDNLLAVIGGGLALIVLIVVWLLRRASAAKRDIFESDSPITDSMVREKLREIDLDLDTPPTGTAGRRSS